MSATQTRLHLLDSVTDPLVGQVVDMEAALEVISLLETTAVTREALEVGAPCPFTLDQSGIPKGNGPRTKSIQTLFGH